MQGLLPGHARWPGPPCCPSVTRVRRAQHQGSPVLSLATITCRPCEARGKQRDVCGAGRTTASPTSNCKHPSLQRKGGQSTSLTWGGGLVDDVISILLGNDGVAHSQEGEELLYARSCGLQAGDRVNPSVTTPLTYTGVRVKSPPV